MTELVASLLLRVVDRWSGPARAAARSLEPLERATQAGIRSGQIAARMTDRMTRSTAQASGANRVAAAATAALTGASTAAVAASQRLAGARTAEAAASTAGARAATAQAQAQGEAARAAGELASGAQRAAEAQTGLASSTTRAGEAAGASYQRFSSLERIQMRGAAAGRAFRGELDTLQGRLGKLALGSIAIDGMRRAADAVNRPVQSAVERAAEYNEKLAGIQYNASLKPRDMGGVAANAMRMAQGLGSSLADVIDDHGAVLNEAVYNRSARTLELATRATAGLQRMAKLTGAELTGKEAGGLTATYAHVLYARPERLEHLNAIVARGSVLGGNRMGDVARFLPGIMAEYKGRAFGNEKGLIESVAALQVIKRATGNDEQAGIDATDFLRNLGHQMTNKHFKKQIGVDLEDVIRQAHARNVSPMMAVVEAVRARVGDDPNDPNLAGKIGKLFQNAYAGQAIMALLQNKRDTEGGPGFDHIVRDLSNERDVDRRWREGLALAASTQQADITRTQNSKDWLAYTTGNTVNPMTRATNAAQRAAAGAATAVQGSVLGRGATLGIAAGAAAADALTKAASGVVSIASAVIVARSVARMARLAPVIGKGQIAAAVVRAAAPQVASRGVQAATRPAAARAYGAGAARAAQAATRAAAGEAAAAAGRIGLLGRVGGALARAPLGELLFLPGLIGDAKRNSDTYGAGALAWLTHDKGMARRAAARVPLPWWAGPSAASKAAAADAPARSAAGAEPSARAPVADLVAFSRSLAADASAMVAHARALGALATAEVAAAAHLNGATLAGAGAGGGPRAPHQTTIHFNQTNHVQNPTDARKTAAELHRLGHAATQRALHDGADG